MTSPTDRSGDRAIIFEIAVRESHPALLDGLEAWLQLGLISDRRVLELCAHYLSCPLSAAIAASPQDSGRALVGPPNRQLVAEKSDFADANIKSSPAKRLPARPQPNPTADFVTRSLQSLMAEISVIWLLFLGVFMVVVSSGVLAASQWENFPAAGQYGILLGYTIVFWLTGAWANRRPNLRLTARMLKILTLLIVPVNFWMMDAFQLWRSSLGLIVTAIAAVVLTAVLILSLRTADPPTPASDTRLIIATSIGLSWLHWGWNVSAFPLIASYIGTLAAVATLFHQWQVSHRRQQVVAARSKPPEESPTAPSLPSPSLVSPLPTLGSIAVAFAVLLLIGRAILVAQVPVSQLGLALGICGWLLCWLSEQSASRAIWTRIGGGLLLAGWAVAVVADPPWQAIAIGGLGLWLLGDRLRRSWKLQDVTSCFFVGLGTFILLWNLVPDLTQQQVIGFFIDWGEATAMPGALIGIGGFPYILLALTGASVLQRQQKPQLADHVQILCLILGGVLALFSLFNPLTRSLNLLLSALTVAGVTLKRSHPAVSLVYFNHILAWTALVSWIEWLFPELPNVIWASLFLGGMMAEWAWNLSTEASVWRQSAWHSGLILAALSYSLLIPEVETLGNWGLIWLLAPVCLTGMGFKPTLPSRTLTAQFSTIAFLLAQSLTFALPLPRLIGLSVGAIGMGINTAHVQQRWSAALTIGFGLSLAVATTWQIARSALTGEIGLNLLAIAVWGLWLLRSQLTGRSSAVWRLYIPASNGWAIALSVLILGSLTGYSLAYYTFLEVEWLFLSAALLITGAIAYRIQQAPTELGFWGEGWGVALVATGGLALAKGTVSELAIAFLALGLLSQFLGDVWVRQTQQPYFRSWHLIPLVYAGVGVGLAHLTFEAATGLYTLAAALIGIGVGRRQPALRFITYCALGSVTIAAYELLVYQLLQAEGNYLGDGVVLLAALATAIAGSDRLFSRWLAPYLRVNPTQLRSIAHLHWIGGSGLLGLAFVTGLSEVGSKLWLGLAVVLAAYALIAGNSRWNPEYTPDQTTEDQTQTLATWTYAGILEAIAALSYGLFLLVPDRAGLLNWAGAIASVLALGIYLLPWTRWGWIARPWRRSAAVLPLAVLLATVLSTHIPSLLITAAFYAWLAKVLDNPRISYFSIGLLDWAFLWFLRLQGWNQPIWISTLLGGSLLYIAQIDPPLQQPSARENRHILRSLSVGLICLTAIYQAESSIGLALLALSIGLALVLVGLIFRVRAYLYVGTATFIFEILRQVWLLISDYSLLLWAIFILIGLVLIWIAATFEARRSQAIALVQYWISALEEWE